MKLNVRLLRRIQRHILAEPKRIQMQYWFTPVDSLPKAMRPACGTVACIAGWAAELRHLSHGGHGFNHVQAFRVLVPEIDEEDEYNVRHRLFFEDSWPDDLRKRLLATKPGTARYAQVVADRIEHFIKTGGKE